MADYAKAKLEVTYSENADYSEPDFKTNWPLYELTPDEGETTILEVVTGGTTVTTSTRYSTITLYAVINLDPTNYVTATWTDNSANANIQKVPAGAILVVPDINGATNPTIQANSATCRCKVVIMGT
jgi:hypothetical protein